MRYFSSKGYLLILISIFSFFAKTYANQSNPAGQKSYGNIILKDSVPSKTTDSSSVDTEADYPGGDQGWFKYLSKHLRYPDEAVNNEIQGNVDVKFFVDKDGNISDIKAINGPKELRAESVKVVSGSGKWIPAKKKGQNVDSYKVKTVKYRLEVSK
ncbi:MAG TPA: energy transducer TonB [Puia sp.]|nr:energy transducer TonB [Puia sp.]